MTAMRLRAIISIPADLWALLIGYLPGRLGYFLRHRYWKGRLGFLGERVRIDAAVYFQNPKFIEIDNNSWIDRGVMILAGADHSTREKVVRRNHRFPGKPGVVTIGKNVHIGPGCIISGISSGVYISDDCGISADCKLYSFTHHYRSRKQPFNRAIFFSPRVSHDRQCIIEGPVFIGRNTGIALNSVILPGVTIPENCFVTINSVVSGGHYKENTIISGHPASAAGSRFKDIRE